MDNNKKKRIKIREKIKDALLAHIDTLSDKKNNYVTCSEDRRKLSTLKRKVKQIDVTNDVVGDKPNRCLKHLIESPHDVLLQVISNQDCHAIQGIDLYGNKFLQENPGENYHATERPDDKINDIGMLKKYAENNLYNIGNSEIPDPTYKPGCEPEPEPRP